MKIYFFFVVCNMHLQISNIICRGSHLDVYLPSLRYPYHIGCIIDSTYFGVSLLVKTTLVPTFKLVPGRH